MEVERLKDDPADIDGVVKLFNLLYPHKPIKTDYIYWRYLTDKLPSSCYVLKENGKVIGSYAGHILPAEVAGRRIKCALTIDAMIHPDFQHRGLIRPLYNALDRELNRHRPSFFYAFVNDLALPLYTRVFGWQQIGRKHLLVADRERLLEVTREHESRLKAQVVRKISPSAVRFLQAIYRKSKKHSFIIRTRNLLHWRTTAVSGKDFRTVEIADNRGNICGLCVFKVFVDRERDRSSGDLVELAADNPANLRVTLKAVCQLVKAEKATGLATWGAINVSNRLLSDLGFQQTPIKSFVIAKGKIPPNFYVNMFDAEMF